MFILEWLISGGGLDGARVSPTEYVDMKYCAKKPDISTALDDLMPLNESSDGYVFVALLFLEKD